MSNLRDVYIIGVGQTPCGKYPTKAAHVLGREASWAAIKDSGIYARDIEIGFCGHVYQGMGVGQRTLKDIGLVGQPVINVEGACGSGTLSFWEAWRTIAFGQHDVALAWGVENLSKIMSGGPLPLEEDDIEVALGMSMPGLYAMRAKRYMDEYGVSKETLAKVVVKSRLHASKNPIAQFRKETTVDAVLGDPVICDFGVFWDGYCSDITRTYFVGGSPSDEWRKIYDIVMEANKRSTNALVEGNTGHLVDKAGRDFIRKNGYGSNFVHGTGHGFGLEIHEFPSVTYKSKVKIQNSMAVTIEPGIYIPGKGGIRIEDDVLPNKENPEVLTKAKKELY